MAVYTWILTGLLHGFSVLCSFGQSHPFLDNFSATVYQGDVYLNWTMLAGNTCNGIQIYHATDTTAFSRIGLIPGICGSLTRAESYSFTDVNPVLNQPNYYRLELGVFGLSQIIAVEVPDVNKGGYQIRPHPVRDAARIYFDKTGSESYQLVLFNQHGIAVGNDTTFDSYFDLDDISLPAGLYFFTISSSTGKPAEINGKLLVAGK